MRDLVVSKFKRVVTKLEKEAADGLKNILINIMIEATKREIWPS